MLSWFRAALRGLVAGARSCWAHPNGRSRGVMAATPTFGRSYSVVSLRQHKGQGRPPKLQWKVSHASTIKNGSRPRSRARAGMASRYVTILSRQTVKSSRASSASTSAVPSTRPDRHPALFDVGGSLCRQAVRLASQAVRLDLTTLRIEGVEEGNARLLFH